MFKIVGNKTLLTSDLNRSPDNIKTSFGALLAKVPYFLGTK
jgi:hypothetical protein